MAGVLIDENLPAGLAGILGVPRVHATALGDRPKASKIERETQCGLYLLHLRSRQPAQPADQFFVPETR